MKVQPENNTARVAVDAPVLAPVIPLRIKDARVKAGPYTDRVWSHSRETTGVKGSSGNADGGTS